MDIEYGDVIDLSGIKAKIKSSGLRSGFIVEQLGVTSNYMSCALNGRYTPKTDIISKLCFILKVPPSALVTFKGIEINDYFKDRPLPYTPPADAEGELTYAPLWNFMEEYLKDKPGKSYHDLFDKIEPPRRRNEMISGISLETMKRVKQMRDEGTAVDSKRVVHNIGLTEKIRTKLRKDRPVNIRTIYDICRFLGCSIDWVLSYK